MAMTAVTRRYLTDEQVASDHQDGYITVRRLLDGVQADALRRVTERFVERSRNVSKSDDVLDLDPRDTSIYELQRQAGSINP